MQTHISSDQYSGTTCFFVSSLTFPNKTGLAVSCSVVSPASMPSIPISVINAQESDYVLLSLIAVNNISPTTSKDAVWGESTSSQTFIWTTTKTYIIIDKTISKREIKELKNLLSRYSDCSCMVVLLGKTDIIQHHPINQDTQNHRKRGKVITELPLAYPHSLLLLPLQPNISLVYELTTEKNSQSLLKGVYIVISSSSCIFFSWCTVFLFLGPMFLIT